MRWCSLDKVVDTNRIACLYRIAEQSDADMASRYNELRAGPVVRVSLGQHFRLCDEGGEPTSDSVIWLFRCSEKTTMLEWRM